MVNNLKKDQKLLLSVFLTVCVIDNVCCAFVSVGSNLQLHKSFSITTEQYAETNRKEWSVIDDWNQLSSENPRNMAMESRRLLGHDVVNAVANLLADQRAEKSMTSSPEDTWLEDAIAHIYENRYVEEQGVTLDNNGVVTKEGNENQELGEIFDQDEFEEKMSQEIALLVRCNQHPEHMLININQGRDIPEITAQQLYDVSQLLEPVTPEQQDIVEKKYKWKPTTFLMHAVHNMFEQHATMLHDSKIYQADNEEEVTKVLDAQGIASWIQIALQQDITTTQSSPLKKMGPHDPSVTDIIAKYGSYGANYLTENEFLELYVATILGDHQQNDDDYSTSSFELLQTNRNVNIMSVWRDIRNHNIMAPNELQRMIDISDMNLKLGLHPDSDNYQSSRTRNDNVVDECELIYENEELRVGEGISYTSDKHGRSSHKSVITIPSEAKDRDSSAITAMAKRTPVPLYMKDTDFVFIDEETCIGCTQCVSIAPASFTMIENGRARSFFQRSATDVKAAVASCPVDCIHFVSYDELVELEVARDVGVRDDHRHFGHTKDRGYIPRVPLHVSRRDSDANHRSSFYHFIKDQCFKSSQCPQRGCYDCPRYKSDPNANPYFQERMKQAQHERAQYLIESGFADSVRKIAEI